MYVTPHGRTRNTLGNRPIFIERSGKRRKILRLMAIALGSVCGAYLMFVAIVIAGLWLPAGQHTPTTGFTLPATPAHHETQRSPRADEEGHQQGGQQGSQQERPSSPLPEGTFSPHPAEATRG
ncbi:hypothetical protein [Streptomyces scopuliridis]|uniref:hypothetical protein n=1 Tax=Streptomyces scopuliridis TaxID=452529 RepID=UPI0035DFEC3B